MSKSFFNSGNNLLECQQFFPMLYSRDVRWNKGTILKASVDYIRRMQKDLQRSRDLENHSRRLEMANKQLWLRIQVNPMSCTFYCLRYFYVLVETAFFNYLTENRLA